MVVVDKSSGKFRELKTIGVASDSSEIEVLEGKAREWIEHYTGQMSLDFDETEKVRSSIGRSCQMLTGHFSICPRPF